MNSCNFIGVVLKDPVTRRDKAGEVIVVTTYLNISVAREAKTKQRYDVLSLKATGTIAENIEKWIRKGNRIGVSCRAEYNRYQRGGKWYSHTIFRILSMYFIDAKNDVPNEITADETQMVDLDTSGLEETEYHDIDFSALD